MDNKELFEALRNELVTGLSATENRILNKVTELDIKIDQVDSKVDRVETNIKQQMNHHFKKLEKELLDDQDDFETSVSGQVESNDLLVTQLQKQIQRLEARIQKLEAKHG